MHGFSSWMKEAHISQTSTEYSLQKASLLLLTLETRNRSNPWCPKKMLTSAAGSSGICMACCSSLRWHSSLPKYSGKLNSHLGSTGLNCWDMKLFIRSPMPSIMPSNMPPTTAEPTYDTGHGKTISPSETLPCSWVLV